MGDKVKLLEQIKNIPNKPGVYIFKDSSGQIIYVGKAKSLKNRVRSYFREDRNRWPLAKILTEKIADFEFYVTDNEIEALVLECNLIKKNKPVFNVRLIDDKSYPYLSIALNDEFPRVAITREIHKKGTKYYGPYTDAKAIRQTLDVLRKIFPVRTCRGLKPGRTNGSPCLNYHIKRCLGPCVGKVKKDEYLKIINEICLFLEGKEDQVVSDLESQMADASRKLEYEKAAGLRNRIMAVNQILKKQRVVLSGNENQDIIGTVNDKIIAIVELFVVRQGKLIGNEGFVLNFSHDDVISSFVKQYYISAASIPEKIVLPYKIEDQDLIENWLSCKKKKKIKIIVPKRGEKKKLLDLAMDNVVHSFELYKVKKSQEAENINQAIKELKEYLKLKDFPLRIECFDISTILGKESVGSMVVFEGGFPKTQKYRKFKIKWVEGQNDFAMMGEIIKRRVQRQLSDKKFADKPDLIIVDGGRSQLKAALNSLSELGLKDVSVVALAKKKEDIYVPDKPEPLSLPLCSPGLYLLKRIRDEAHRFAITYHRDLRRKKMVKSIFDEIPGIGEKRKKKLIDYFKTPEAIKQAALDELKKVLPKSIAENVYKFLQR